MDETIDIRHIARLARLHIDDAEIPKLAREMSSIVGEVSKLPNFEDTSIPLNEKDAMTLREDTAGSSTPRGKILQNAPRVEAGCVVVPKIVE